MAGTTSRDKPAVATCRLEKGSRVAAYSSMAEEVDSAEYPLALSAAWKQEIAQVCAE
jgi:hypothetical protein